MPTSAPGNRAAVILQPGLKGLSAPARRRRRGGFTLLELLVVMAVIAVGVSLVVLSLPDRDAARLDEEGARLTALLESARAESRTSGMAVWWVPRSADDNLVGAPGEPERFRFVGLPKAFALPGRWLDDRVSAQVVGAQSIMLGPEAILPAQRIVLTLGERRLELASDGLGPFTIAEPAPAEARR
jgi:general secretion pathway protein H